MTSPSSIPLSSQDSGAAPAASTLQPSAAVRSFIGRLYSSINQSLSNRRPWTELIDRSAFSRPESLSDATTRIRKNYSYFRVNYTTLLAIVLAVSLISHPFSLITLVSLLAAWLFLYSFRPSDQPLVVMGRTFSDRETLGILMLVTVVVIFLTSVGSLLISATMVGVGVVCVHGAFRDPEDLFMDDQEGSGAGLFSFIGGSATNAGAQMMSRV
ncbi:PRA1 family protein B4 [Linum perenne]